MKKSVVFMHNQNRTQFMCTCKDKDYLTKAAMDFIDCAARELNMKRIGLLRLHLRSLSRKHHS